MSDDLSMEPWRVDERDFPADGTAGEQAVFLLRYAVLAPSSHNSQPWQFAVDGATVDVHRDDDRWLSVADADRRELHVSLGCALANLLVAARHFGFGYDVTSLPRESEPGSDDSDSLVARVELRPDDSGSTSDGGSGDDAHPVPFDAITERRTAHGPFADRDVPPAVRDRLRRAATGASSERTGQARESADDRVDLHLVDDADAIDGVARLQAEADERLFDDPDYRRELGYWIGTGGLGANWLAARVGQVAVTRLDLGPREGRKNSALVRSTPLLAVFAAPAGDRAAQLAVGRAFERLALAATAEGVAVHPVSQTLEVPPLRADLADLLGLAGAPQHLVRLGYADEDEDHTPRRPVEAVLR